MNVPADKPTHVRYAIIAMLFIASTFSYGDRVVLSIASISFTKDLHLDAIHMAYIFSGFSWTYALAQLLAGGLLDRYGSKRVYGFSILAWSLLAFLVGLAGYLPAATAFTAIFVLRLLSGLAQSPVFPGNGCIVAAWFPTAERGRASAIFNSSQYFSVVAFAPVMGWIATVYGWKECFWFLAILGVLLSIIWSRVIFDVNTHPRINQLEVEHIEQGGGLLTIAGNGGAGRLTWDIVFRMLRNRMLLGIYLGQFCIVTLTWFFLTWFPVYLSKAQHMSILKVGLVAALPALCGFTGGILGGTFSDSLLKMGRSLTFARKLPIVMGMLLSMLMIACNYIHIQWLIILVMSIAFFGKGFGALGWTLISDTSPKGLTGMNGGVFNLIGNLAGISTPLVIGLILQKTGSFNDALLFVGGIAVLAILSFLLIVGDIRRLDRSDLYGQETAA